MTVTELKVLSLGQTRNTEGLKVMNSRKQGLTTDDLWITKVAARFTAWKSSVRLPVLVTIHVRSDLYILWVILSIASANTNLLMLLLGQGGKACLCSCLGPYKSALLTEGIAIGMNIWPSGSESKIAARAIFCSHLSKQYMFNLPQRELRYDKKKLQCGFNFPIAWPERDTLKSHSVLQKYSP